MIARVAKGVLLMLLTTVWGAAGCGPPNPTHFDESAVAGIHSLTVLPMVSSSEGAGAFASGLTLVHLMKADLPGLTVTEAPALWRLSRGATVMALTSAADAGGRIGADGALTGTVVYVLPPKDNANATATVTVQIFSVGSGQLAYENTGTAKDGNIPNAFTRAIAQSLIAFEDHLRKTRKQ